MKNKRRMLTALLFLGMTSMANAGFLSLDWKTDGDNQATLHEETGIEWLKLNNTAGYSVPQIKTMLGEGGIFEGWRLPTALEVTDVNNFIWQTSHAPEDSYRETKSIPTAEAKALFDEYSDALGLSYVYNTTEISAGILENDSGHVVLSGMEFGYQPATSTNYYYNNYVFDSKANSANYSGAPYGVYLVGDGGATKSTQEDMSLTSNNPNSTAYNANATSVPEPATMAIFGLGLAGLAYRRKGVAK